MLSVPDLAPTFLSVGQLLINKRGFYLFDDDECTILDKNTNITVPKVQMNEIS